MMVRRRSVALPSHFPWPRSRRRDLTGRPLSSPVCHRQIAPLVPTSVGWDDCCVPLSYKKGNSPSVLSLPTLACFRAQQYRHSCLPLRLVLANPSLAHLCFCSAHSPSKLFRRYRRQPPEEARKKTERRTSACIADHALVRGNV
jgi:hypothetical protein